MVDAYLKFPVSFGAETVRAACHLIFNTAQMLCQVGVFVGWGMFLEHNSEQTERLPGELRINTHTVYLFTVCSSPFGKAAEPVKLLHSNGIP